MKKTIFNDSDRADVLARIDRITDASKPRWGRMTADRMLAHVAESLKMALGTLSCKPAKLPIRFFPLKQLIIYVLPFPKGAPTSPELLAGAEVPVGDLKPELQRLIGDLGTRRDQKTWPIHPAFGKLSGKAWGALMYKHADHHLRQFGV